MQVILTHENSDFDAVASLLGAHKLYPNARPVLPHRVNRNVQAFLDLYTAELPFIIADTLPRGQHIRRVILVDTQSLTTVRGMGRNVRDVLIIDHHTPPTSLPDGWRFQGEVLGAATTLLVEALSTRLVPLSRVEATLMLAGIYEDTGSLTYSATTPRDLRAAAWLIDQGASLELAIEFLEHPLTPAQQEIYNMLKAHAETLELDGHPVLLSWALSPPNVEEEVSTLAHKLRDLFDPSAVFILVQIGAHTQLVARSATDDINVAEVAQHFSGGGHDRAAAALIHERRAQSVHEELRDILSQFVQPRVKVQDLMSYGVRTVHPYDTIAMVAQQMLRTGHEGFPVVTSTGHITGLVTRNAVDRAMQHHWERQPVHRIMQQGETAVSPADSAERVRTLMIRSGWGQIPVVEDNQVIGVVTRTDMIRMPPSEQETAHQDIIRRMNKSFPAPLLVLIQNIGSSAAQMGYTLYFVGGVVRDLLLRQPIFDADLVVEGDAIKLGRKLAEAYGGEIHTYRRFGTVKWTLPDNIWEISYQQANKTREQPPHNENQTAQYVPPTLGHPPKTQTQLPAHIDLVTARTEFYERPTALPTVERSSIKQDLHRRDFTINTLAIRLDPQRWGELLDFYGGKADLDQGIIRVLHSLSFVDDPTRILRAARFEARLNFHLDHRSESLIGDALPLLERVTGGRIRHELDLIFQETKPEHALDRLQALNVLPQIHPDLVSDAWLHERFARLRQASNLNWWEVDDENSRLFLHWALFLYRLDQQSLRQITERLLMSRRIREATKWFPKLAPWMETLAQWDQPSQIVDRLDTLDLDIQAVAWLITDDCTARDHLENYAHTWRHIHPALNGNDLKQMGIPPGPIYRDIFRQIRAARLDGELTKQEEEITFVKAWIQNHNDTAL